MNTAPAIALLDAAKDIELPQNANPVQSTKTFGHDIGLSCAFRQHRAQSHCRFLHGYALGIRFVFEANQTDHCGWVVDFGGLKSLRAQLEATFDHKLLVAKDDPQALQLLELQTAGLAEVVIVPATGCEAFAAMIYETTQIWLHDAGFAPRVRLVSVEVSEHGANSAIYRG
jgi:6-pyruvoyltetrahydropterin/6-carboxytetrahydropterin synthase